MKDYRTVKDPLAINPAAAESGEDRWSPWSNQLCEAN